MAALKTCVIMKTDISGSIPRFRAMLAADVETLLGEHRDFVARHALAGDGRIIKAAGDGYWLEFPSATAAARAAIAMQEALQLAQPNRGDDRIAMRVVIALGDVSYQDGEPVGDVMALVARIETITPPDEIYLSLSARLAANEAEIRTASAGSFALKGFAEPVAVYRVEQRHRTQVVADQYILFSDLRGFGQLMQMGEVAVVERILDALHALVHAVAREHEGTVRFNAGDAYCLTFLEARQAVAAAEQLSDAWHRLDRRERADCALNIAMHLDVLYAFRSFLYGPGIHLASQVQDASADTLPPGEGGIFVTAEVRARLTQTPWHNRLQPVEVRPRRRQISLEVYRLRR
jgi:class 3 adenylate cyclase